MSALEPRYQPFVGISAADICSKIRRDSNPRAVYDSTLDAAAGALADSFKIFEMDLGVVKNAVAIIESNAPETVKDRAVKDTFYIYNEIKNKKLAAVRAAKKAKVDAIAKAKRDFLDSNRRAILQAEIQRINSSDAYIKQRAEAILDAALVEKTGRYLDYLANIAYNNSPNMKLIASKPVNAGCPDCHDAAEILSQRIESRRPRPEPFTLTPDVGESADDTKRRILWLAGGTGEKDLE